MNSFIRSNPLRIRKLLLMALLWFIAMPLWAQEEVMTPELLWELGRVHSVQVSPYGNAVLYGVKHYDVQKNKGESTWYIYELGSKSKRKVNFAPDQGHSLSWTPDGRHIAYLKDGQIYEMSLDGNEKRQVTDEDGKITTFRYAPDMSILAFTKEVKLEKNTKDRYPELDQAEVMVIDDLMYRHWNHWNDEYYSHLYYAPYSDGKLTGKSVDIMEGEPYDVPTVPFGGVDDYTIDPEGQMIVYVSKKKKGKGFAVSTNTDLYRYNINTKVTRNLTEGMKGYDTHPVFSKSGNHLAWLSMAREGYESDKNVLKMKDMRSGNVYNLTEDWDESVTSFVWGKNDKTIYFLAGKQATYQLFALEDLGDPGSVTEKNVRQITEGMHNYRSLELSNKGLIGMKQSMSQASEIYKINPKNGEETPITKVNDQTFDEINLGKVEKRMVKTTDGKDMLVWVIYPPDFDPNKKYPALLYCQGGPQSAVSQFFSYRWNFQLMAANGYIVVAPNRRGLPSFGTEWNEAISGDWGGQAMKDYLSAIDEVAKEPYVDEDKLGAVGASYGGYSVYMLAGIHEGRFKAFVSHCGLFDMKSWYGTTEELFFANWDLGGPYWADPQPKAYSEFNPSEYVKNWDTPILVIHGGKDFRVPEGQGMQAFQVAQLKGIPSRFLYFPNEGHWVLQPQNGLIWHREFFRWLDEYLK